MEFLDFYNTFRQNASNHNSELALRRSSIIGERINPVEGRDLDTQQLSSIAMDVRTRLVIAGAGTGKTLYLVAVNHKESIFFREIISNHSVLGEPAPYKRVCPKCGGEMVLRKGRFGEFYGCSNFLSKGCRYTMKK